MSIRQLPSPRWTIPGNSGAVAAGYYVYTYQPGTSTPKATYTDHTGATPNTNPIVLDARGEANIWWDGQYKVLAYTGDKDAGGVLVWSQDNYGEGTASPLYGNFNLVLNGSFEEDADGDGHPDDWTIVEYTDGTVERDFLESTHGAYSLKFTSVGTGGGIADSSLFAVQEARIVPVSFALKSSIATVHNRVDVVWLTGGGAVLSSTTLYDDDTTNPVNWTHYNYNATPPVNARFGKLRCYGCHEDNAQAGMTWIDNIQVEATTVVAGLFPNVTQAVTATHDELNVLDGMQSTTDELNSLWGVGGNVQAQLDGKRAIFRGCLAYKQANQSIAAGAGGTAVVFDAEIYDTDEIHSTVTNASRLTVPAGVTRVSLSANVTFEPTAYFTQIAFAKNGSSAFVGGVASDLVALVYHNISTAAIPVVGGDYFELRVSHGDASPINVKGMGDASSVTWFAMEIIE